MPSADELFPIIVYCIMSANPANLQANLKFISEYLSQSRKLNKEGFVLTNLEAAIKFLHNLDSKALLKGEVKLKEKKKPKRAGTGRWAKLQKEKEMRRKKRLEEEAKKKAEEESQKQGGAEGGDGSEAKAATDAQATENVDEEGEKGANEGNNKDQSAQQQIDQVGEASKQEKVKEYTVVVSEPSEIVEKSPEATPVEDEATKEVEIDDQIDEGKQQEEGTEVGVQAVSSEQ